LTFEGGVKGHYGSMGSIPVSSDNIFIWEYVKIMYSQGAK